MTCSFCGGRLMAEYDRSLRTTDMVCINCGRNSSPASPEPYSRERTMGATGRSRLVLEGASHKLYPRPARRPVTDQ